MSDDTTLTMEKLEAIIASLPTVPSQIFIHFSSYLTAEMGPYKSTCGCGRHQLWLLAEAVREVIEQRIGQKIETAPQSGERTLDGARIVGGQFVADFLMRAVQGDCYFAPAITQRSEK